MPLPIILMLCITAVATPLFIWFAIRTNAQYVPDRTIPGTKIRVKYWDNLGESAKDINAKSLQIEGVDMFLHAAREVIEAKLGKEAADKIFDFDLWIFPFETRGLSLSAQTRYNEDGSIKGGASGLVETYGLWFGLKKRIAVRIRNMNRGDVTTTALGHEIAWHMTPSVSMKNWNRLHRIDMSELEAALTAAYKVKKEESENA